METGRVAEPCPARKLQHARGAGCIQLGLRYCLFAHPPAFGAHQPGQQRLGAGGLVRIGPSGCTFLSWSSRVLTGIACRAETPSRPLPGHGNRAVDVCWASLVVACSPPVAPPHCQFVFLKPKVCLQPFQRVPCGSRLALSYGRHPSVGDISPGQATPLPGTRPRDVRTRNGLLRSRTRKECLNPSLRSCPLRPGTGRGPASPKPRPSPVAVAQTGVDAPLGQGLVPARWPRGPAATGTEFVAKDRRSKARAAEVSDVGLNWDIRLVTPETSTRSNRSYHSGLSTPARIQRTSKAGRRMDAFSPASTSALLRVCRRRAFDR